MNTYRGLFIYTRLLYGTSSIPGIFQQVMENFLAWITNLILRLYDISGKNDVRGVSIYMGPMWQLITLLIKMCYFLFLDLKIIYYNNY